MTGPTKESSRRLFFALWPDPRVRTALDRLAAGLHAACGGRRMPARNLHVTLAFLGECTPAQREAAIGAARDVVALPCTLIVDRLGFFRQRDARPGNARSRMLARQSRAAQRDAAGEGERSPSGLGSATGQAQSSAQHCGIVWAGGTGPAALISLRRSLANALVRAQVPFDRQAFVPHVTLLREASPAREAMLDPIEWSIRNFVLVSSARDAGGVRYEVDAGPFGVGASARRLS